jgi:hypothetical protein
VAERTFLFQAAWDPVGKGNERGTTSAIAATAMSGKAARWNQENSKSKKNIASTSKKSERPIWKAE